MSAEYSGMKANGVLIQAASPADVDKCAVASFRGIGALPAWPLESVADAECDNIVGKVNRQFLRFAPDGGMALHVLPDLDLVRNYAAECARRGLAVRSLLCFTALPEPFCVRASEIAERGVMLGYDLAARSCDFSLIFDDLFGQPVPELSQFRKLVNEVGLFDEFTTLSEYIAVRRRLCAQADCELERDLDCCAFRLVDCSALLTPADTR